MSNEVEETMKRIQSHKGVVGTIVVNSEGIPIKTTFDNTTTVQYASGGHIETKTSMSTNIDV
jgi:dynein light chain roadblock-type